MNILKKIIGFGLLIYSVPRVVHVMKQVIESGGDPQAIGAATASVLFVAIGLWLLFSKDKDRNPS
ncbi:hypothetical protein [Acaryochloris marina]|nr:hypothetical protein [Acaryochloris marina]BDM83906.1 hypothetical protein AM10699_67670 [Acaryochloris marina MBIC10699]